jgi:hypothetical protein
MESVRGQGRSRKPPVASFKDAWNLFGWYASPADIQDSSRDSSNHVLQETVATNPEDPGCIGTFPGCFEYRSSAVLNFRGRRTE